MGNGPLWQRCALALLPWLFAAEAISGLQRGRRIAEEELDEESFEFFTGVDLSMCSRLLGNATMKAVREMPARAPKTRPSTMPTTPAVLYFLHIPKAAGGSFDADVRDMLGDSVMMYLSKEGCYEWASCVPDAGVVTLLRNPRSHVLSQYAHCTSLPTRPEKWKEEMPPFEEWIRRWAEMRENGEAYDDFAPKVPKGRGPKEVANTETRTPFKCYSPIDMQTQRLACQQTFNYKTGRTLDMPSIARSNLRKSWMVGIVEAYPESMCLLYEKVHQELPDTCNCLASEDGRGRPPNTGRQMTYGVRPHSLDDVPEDVLQVVDRLTAADRQLYREGVQRFVREVRAAEARHGTQVLCNATFSKLQPYLD